MKETNYDGYRNLCNKTQEEIDNLKKRYQQNIDTLIKDYDEVIKEGLIGIIANSRVNGIIRADIVDNLDILIRIRKFVINQYSNDSSNND